MLIGTFRTIPLQNFEGEWGFLEHDLIVGDEAFASSVDKKGFINFRIANELAQLCARHGTPKELWDFQPSSTVRKHTGLPESIPFR